MIQRIVAWVMILFALFFAITEEVHIKEEAVAIQTVLKYLVFDVDSGVAFSQKPSQSPDIFKDFSIWERGLGSLILTLIAIGMLRIGWNKTPKEITEGATLGALVLYDDKEATHQNQRYRINDRGRPYIVFGLICASGFLGGLVLWSVLAPIESAAVAPGTVKVESNRLVVNHPEGGTIDKLLVQEGTSVIEGQPLIHLDTSEVATKLDVLKRRRDRLLLIRARLIAEQAGYKSVEFPAEIIRRTESDADLKEILGYQRALFKANLAAFNAEEKVRERQIEQFERQIEGFEAELSSKKAQLEIIKEELTDLEGLFQKGLAPQRRVLALRRERVKFEGELGSIKARIAEANSRIVQSALGILKLEREKQQRISESLKSVSGEYFELLPKIDALEEKLDRRVLKSPTDGVVFGLTKFTVGGVIGPGEKVLEIVPKSSNLVVEIEIDPNDRDAVRPGMMVDIRLTPYASEQLEPIQGRLRSISADIMEDERTAEQFYVGRVELPQAELRSSDITLSPGMPTQAMIPLGARSAVAYLFDPLTRTLERSMREQ